jgi:hypothetical protein
MLSIQLGPECYDNSTFRITRHEYVELGTLSGPIVLKSTCQCLIGALSDYDYVVLGVLNIEIQIDRPIDEYCIKMP